MFVVNATVAQLDRVLGYEPNGRGFESLRLHQKKRVSRNWCSLFSWLNIEWDSNGVLRKQSSGLFLASGVIAAQPPAQPRSGANPSGCTKKESIKELMLSFLLFIIFVFDKGLFIFSNGFLFGWLRFCIYVDCFWLRFDFCFGVNFFICINKVTIF